MVMVGDKLFHWRYGELKVLKLENGKNRTYIHAKVTDLDGIAEDPSNSEWGKYFRQEEKVFNDKEIGYWLHQDIYDAVLKNRNNAEPYPKSLEPRNFQQGQSPLGMTFPIKGNLLHKLYDTILEKRISIVIEIEELEKKKRDKEGELKFIDKTYEKYKLKYDAIIQEVLLLKDIKNTIEVYIIKNKVEGQEHKFLEYFIEDYIKGNFDWGKSHENGINKIKVDFKNDDEYNNFVKRSEFILIEITEEHNKNMSSITKKLNDIYLIKPSRLIEDVIEKYKMNIELVSKDEIHNNLEKEKENETHELKLQIEEISRKIEDKGILLEKYNNLDDNNYIVFE